MFAGKAEAYLSEALLRRSTLVLAPGLTRKRIMLEKLSRDKLELITKICKLHV